VLTLDVRLPARDYTPDARASFYERLEERLRAVPSVSGVATTTALPTPVMGRSDFRIEGVTWPADVQPFATVASVSDDYFRTMRIALREGRTFGAIDRADGPATAGDQREHGAALLANRWRDRRTASGSGLTRMRRGPRSSASWRTCGTIQGAERRSQPPMGPFVGR
jgi:hypothetical protein